jgi:hypothetical protein
MRNRIVLCLGLISAALALPAGAAAQDQLPVYLRDRGEGIATSMFGTYIRPGELLIYPFYEYYRDKDAEYKPKELGFGVDEDFRGKYRANEFLIWFGYGISDWVAVEFEAATIDATQYKSDKDPSAMPDKLQQSGLGDVEGQVRWRWNKEDQTVPELFSFFEAVFPTQKKDKKLLGTPDWEFSLGVGATKGFSWGTLTARASMEYSRDEGKTDAGEFAFEYLKRVSDKFRVFTAIEGTQDEVELIVEGQFFLTPSAFLKLNSGFGLTSKATDFAPEIGVMFSF